MNSYNFRQIDKNIKPVEENITRQVEKGPNVLRVVLSSNDNANVDSGNNKIHNLPIYNVPTSLFHKFDPKLKTYIFYA